MKVTLAILAICCALNAIGQVLNFIEIRRIKQQLRKEIQNAEIQHTYD